MSEMLQTPGVAAFDADLLGQTAIAVRAAGSALRERFGEGRYQELRNDFHRNARDNFVVELGKHGLGKRDIVANVNFFVKVTVGHDGGLSFVPNHSPPGGYVVLRAEMNTLVVLSNTPHPLDPGTSYAPKPVLLSVRSGAPASLEDACRLSRPENARGFTLTESYFAGRA